MKQLTSSIFKAIAPKISTEKAAMLAELHNNVCPLYGIDTSDILEDFLANEAHESKFFSTLSESLNYKAVALISKFGRHRISIEDANRYGRIDGKQKANEQAIANCLYGGKWGERELGNTLPTDGWNLRGSGLMQLTGRRMIGKFAVFYNKKFGTKYTTEQMADLLRSDWGIAVHGACWVFAIEKGLIEMAKADQITSIRKRINGGTFGLEDVIELTNVINKLLK